MSPWSVYNVSLKLWTFRSAFCQMTQTTMNRKNTTPSSKPSNSVTARENNSRSLFKTAKSSEENCCQACIRLKTPRLATWKFWRKVTAKLRASFFLPKRRFLREAMDIRRREQTDIRANRWDCVDFTETTTNTWKSWCLFRWRNKSFFFHLLKTYLKDQTVLMSFVQEGKKILRRFT